MDLRSFMLVLWRLGINDTLFASMDGIEDPSLVTRYAKGENTRESIASRRVRLVKSKPEEF
ncbi:hypothetical protein [Pseudomonas sp. nanlin1]|uniref:hypothetical protein n=1 Tax=Pseudomonas sp. nanlin1 TaxID=3040605 RepID=UPI00388E3EA5